MVRINNVVTGAGDGGETRLADGSKVSKASQVMEAIGAIDETNSILGCALCEEIDEEVERRLLVIQNDLFDCGSDLAVPPGGPHEARVPRIGPRYVARLEAWIDEYCRSLPALESFILPGGCRAAAQLFCARAQARRAERALVAAWPTLSRGALHERPPLLLYCNRLSDLLFQMARQCNQAGDDERLWIPGGGS